LLFVLVLLPLSVSRLLQNILHIVVIKDNRRCCRSSAGNNAIVYVVPGLALISQ